MSLSNEQSTTAIILVVHLFFCAFLNIFVGVSFLCFHYPHYKPRQQLGPFLVVFLCAILSFNNFLSTLSALYNDGMTGPWCEFIALSSTTVTAGSLFTHGFLALDRYFLVVHAQNIAWKWVALFFVLLYSIVVIASVSALVYSPIGYVPMESQFYCYFNLTGNSIPDKISSSLAIVVMLGFSQIISHCYLQLYCTTRQSSRAVKQLADGQSHSTQVHSTRPIITDLEKKILYRCMLLSGSFLLCYFPYAVTVLYRVSSGQKVASWVDCVTVSFTQLDPLLTPFLVCFMSVDMRQSALHYLPLTIRRMGEKWLNQKTSTEREANNSIITRSTKKPLELTSNRHETIA